MKQIFEGTFCGGYSAKVYLDFEECGSSVEFPHDSEPYHVITIGANFDEWDEVFDGIFHEMMEFHMCSMELTFQRWYRAGSDSGDIWFHMSHAQYSECISRSTQSILAFLDIAKKEFDKHIKNMLKPKPNPMKKGKASNDTD